MKVEVASIGSIAGTNQRGPNLHNLYSSIKLQAIGYHDGKIEVKLEDEKMRANVTSFFPHDTHTTLTKDHLQASRVVCHLANHDADIATYVTGQHKVCSHHSVKKD